MKKCIKCGLKKTLDEYYRHKQTRDGYLNKCKSCAKEDTRNNRKANSEYYKEYDRKRFQEDPRVRLRHKRYQKTEEGKASLKKSKEKWISNNRVKRATHISVGNALTKGLLKKPNKCEECGKEGGRINGHHDDYTKPLEVRWLCCLCHTKWHKENGEGKL